MAIENETSMKHETCVKNNDLINVGDDKIKDKHEMNSSLEEIAVEIEFEKYNSLEGNLTNAKTNEDVVENDVFEIQVEDGESGKDVADSTVTQKQANTYAAKKTVAQGMMDIALITANANQLRYIIEFNRNSSTYYLNLILIVISLLLQVGVGISLIFKGRLDLRGESKHKNAKKINNYVVVGIFLVTIINVFIASFTITGTGTLTQKH